MLFHNRLLPELVWRLSSHDGAWSKEWATIIPVGSSLDFKVLEDSCIGECRGGESISITRVSRSILLRRGDGWIW
jgi:hypothetical protein